MLDLAHESTHQMSGGTFSAGERMRTGFSNESRGEQKRVTLTEIATHHVALGILTGDFETFDPDKRADKNRTHYLDRKVYTMALEGSNGVMQVRSLTRALFEDSGPEGSTHFRRVLVGEATDAFGARALHKIQELTDYAYKLYGLVDMKLISKYIQPPVVENGKVVVQGVLDVEAAEYNRFKNLKKRVEE